MSDYKCGFDAHSQQDRAFGGGHPDPAAMLTTELRDELKRVTAERDRLAGEVERLKATFNTATVEQVLKAMQARAEAVESERDRLKAAITTHVAGCVACGGSGVVFLCPERDDTAEAIREGCEECYGLRKALAGETTTEAQR